MKAAELVTAVTALAPLVAKIPDAVQKLDSWFNGGPTPHDVLAALPELPDLSRGDLELEAMKARAAAAAAGGSGGTGGG